MDSSHHRCQIFTAQVIARQSTLSRHVDCQRPDSSTVAFPVAISHKVSVDTKTLRFFNPDAKNFTKMNLNTQAVPFLGPHAQLCKRTNNFYGRRPLPFGGHHFRLTVDQRVGIEPPPAVCPRRQEGRPTN